MQNDSRAPRQPSTTRGDRVLPDMGETVDLTRHDRRRRPRQSFLIEWPGQECAVCAGVLAVGQRARFAADGSIHHVRHAAPPEPVHEVCPLCWLTRPCDCGR